MKAKISFIPVLAVIMAVIMFAQPLVIQATSTALDNSAVAGKAEYKKGRYISDVRLFKGSLSDAKSDAESEGYTLFTDNLNEYTDRKGIYLGYKTNSDKSKAIRDIKMLEMGHGYEWLDYQKIVEGQSEKLEPLADDILNAAKEFKANLKENSRAAKLAKDYLNYIYFTPLSSSGAIGASGGKTKISLGDYLSGNNIDKSMIKKMIIQGNGGSVTAMYSQLALAVSDTDDTWAERISKAETFTDEPTSAKVKEWDKVYYEYALALLPSIRDFATSYKEAKARMKKNNDKAQTAEIDTDDKALNAENAQEVIDSSSQDDAGDMVYLTAHGLMNNFTVGDGKVGDYIVDLGSHDYSKRTDYRNLYPLVEALTNGQLGLMKIVGVAQSALYLNHSSEFYDEIETRKSDTLESIKKASNGESQLWMWAGVNTEFYQHQVALSTQAYRESKADSIYTDLTREGEFYDNMNLAFMYVGLASSACAIVISGVALGLFIAGSSLTVWAACAGAIGAGVFATIGGVLGCLAVIGGWVTLASLVVLGIVYFVNWLIDKYSDEDKEDYYEMPTELYDVQQVRVDGKNKSEYIKYDSINNSDDVPQDINADDGRRWNLLYSTKNEHVGSPLMINDLGQIFKRTVNNATTPEGYESVCCVGESSAANLNSYVRKKGADSLYLHFITEDNINGTVYQDDEEAEEAADDKQQSEGFNNGEVIKLKKNEKYLYQLMISSESNESAAKTAITKETGFKIYDVNLTPDKGFTYIGYKSTSVKGDAITDIRVVPNYRGDSIAFGGASYSVAGYLPDGSALVYSRYECVGSPIINSFVTSEKHLGIESPYEPVNMLCGGEAYDINKANKKSPMYLYFKPSVAYTSGQKYVGGVQFMAYVKGEKTRPFAEVVEELGLKYYNVNLASYSLFLDKHTFNLMSGKDIPTFKWSAYEVYMCYAETYNPYRAIYDAAIHTATIKLNPTIYNTENYRYDAMPLSIQGQTGAYTAAEVNVLSNKAFQEGYDLYSKFKDGKYWKKTEALEYGNSEALYLNPTRAYLDPYCGSQLLWTIQAYNGIQFREKLNLEGNITYGLQHYRMQGFYQLGPVKDKAPLKSGDIFATTKIQSAAKYHSIQRFNDITREGRIVVGYNSSTRNRSSRYIYMKGASKAKPKYICGIDVATYERPESTERHKISDEEYKIADRMADDSCIIKLLSTCDQVYNYNLAIDQKDAWYNKADTTNNEASYIGVKRTDDESIAITGLLMYKTSDEETPPVRLKVDGVEYHRAGDKVKDYYFYYTKNPAANPGLPIEDLSFDNIPIIDGSATVLGISNADNEGNASYMSDFKGCNLYIHMKENSDHSVISGLAVVKGDKTAAGMEAMKKGFNYLMGESLNAGTGGTEIYLAYKKTSKDALTLEPEDFEEAGEDFDENWDDGDDDWDFEDEDWSDFDFDFDQNIPEEDVVRDIICLVGKDAPNTINHKGAEYRRVSETSLNEGTNGKTVYLYCTTQSHEDEFLPPITAMCLCSGDAVPSRDDNVVEHGRWEKVLDDNSDEVDFNDSVLIKKLIGSSLSDGQRAVDSRLYMFVQRHNGGVKTGGRIDRGIVSDRYNIGNLIIK